MKSLFKIATCFVLSYFLCYLGVRYDLWINDWIYGAKQGLVNSGIFASQHWVTAMYLTSFTKWLWINALCAGSFTGYIALKWPRLFWPKGDTY